MAKASQLLNSLDSSSEEYGFFLQELLSESSDVPLEAEELSCIEDVIITSINTQINKANTRGYGLNLLIRFLPRISKETLLKYGTLWITKASQSLESVQSNLSELTIACKVLAALVVNCKEIPELHKQISMQNVKQFINLISSMKAENRCGATYYLIAVLLHHYPEVCERSQVSIRKMIIPHVDSSQQNLVTAGANCFALLSKATKRTFKPPTNFANYSNWLYNELLLCNSLHDVMNKLFCDIKELISSDKHDLDASETLDLSEIPEDNVLEYYSGLERRFINLCVYLSTMLRGCGDKNSVSPTDILQVLCRGLAITPSNLGKDDSVKRQILFFMLPKLHVSLLEVFNAFIEGFQRELMPFSHTILKLVQQTLDWTDKFSLNHETLGLCKPFKNVRKSAYETLTVWLINTGSLSGIETHTKYFVPHILQEIKVVKKAVLLTVKKTSHLSKKTQKKLRDSQYENSSALGNSSNDARDSNLNADLCEKALVALQNILSSGDCGLNVSFYEKVKEEVVNLLYNVYLEASESNVYKANKNCRLQLLKTLKALQMYPHPLTPPPTQFSIEIFNMALKDEDLIVSQEAKLGLAELEKIVHPSAPTLDFPIQTKEKSKTGDESEESSEVIKTNAFSQQRSMNELLDSIHSNEYNEQTKKRALESEEIILSKLPRTEFRKESEPIISKVMNPDCQSSDVEDRCSNLEESNKELLVTSQEIINPNVEEQSLNIEIKSGSSFGNCGNFSKNPEIMDTEITQILTVELDNEDDVKVNKCIEILDSEEDENLLQLFVDESQEDN